MNAVVPTDGAVDFASPGKKTSPISRKTSPPFGNLPNTGRFFLVFCIFSTLHYVVSHKHYSAMVLVSGQFSMSHCLVGRFAPSPTGPLHFGSLVAALASFLDAKHRSGKWLVRMEDVDEARCRPEWASSILRTLEAHNLLWDGEVVFQSARKALYDDALAQLRTKNRVYACLCTRRELALLPRNALGEAVYPGTCSRGVAEVAGRQFSERFRVHEGSAVRFEDELLGRLETNLWNESGDFIVKRADGFYAYHLAVVVDDALQGVTDVVRGGDLLAATPRHILLQQALGFSTPRYLHLPLAMNKDGQKLSKQSKSPALESARASENLVEALQSLGQIPEGPIAQSLRKESPASILAFSLPRWSRDALPRRASFVVESRHG